ncbi:phage/plasmid primase, P4 family [Thomasclavelia sp.]|uniref:DNA primase family protein n=1 Tax=Thomasclavelia sp. TaxID=3025757 RepID=UPI0025F315D0|nr:DNA primase family protein [Thomasclavelia sp.]
MSQKSKLNRTQEYYEKIKELDPYNSGEDKRELDVTKWFSLCIRDILVYNADDKQFWYFNGKYWEADNCSVFAQSQADYFCDAIKMYSNHLDSVTQKKGGHNFKAKYYAVESYIKAINNLGKFGNRAKLLKDVAHRISVCYEDFDKDKNLINCQNGTYDIRNKVFRKHRSEDLITKITPVVYKEDAVSDDWNKFLNEVMDEDQSKVEYLQKLFGYCLTGSTVQGQMYIFYGETTRNGKSTMTETVSYVLGRNKGYSSNSQPDMIAQKKMYSRGPSEDIARLKGVRAVFISEPPKNMVLNCALIKQLVGEDTVTARKLYGHEFEFMPECKIIMHTNYLPRFYDESLVKGNKLVVITFNRHFSEEEQDHTLKKRLQEEDNVSGIFNWMLKGLEMYESEGLKKPSSIEQDTSTYYSMNDYVGNFIAEHLIPMDDAVENGTSIYNRYKEFCKAEKIEVCSNREFYKALEEHGVAIDHGKVDGRECRKRIRDFKIRKL